MTRSGVVRVSAIGRGRVFWLAALGLAAIAAACGGTPAAPTPSSKTIVLATPVPSTPVPAAAGAAGSPAPASKPAGAAGLPGRDVPEEGEDHAPEGDPITYQHYPPASGTHYDRWVRYGVYDIEIPEGYWVHNLEHGAIVLLYKCRDDCAGQVAQIKQIYDRLPNGKYGAVKLLATRYERMASNYAVVAWNRIDEMDRLDADRVTRFYQAFVDKGPEDVP